MKAKKEQKKIVSFFSFPAKKGAFTKRARYDTSSVVSSLIHTHTDKEKETHTLMLARERERVNNEW